MTTGRTLTRALAALTIAASTVCGGLSGATRAAYACHVDCGGGMLHGRPTTACLATMYTRPHLAAHRRAHGRRPSSARRGTSSGMSCRR